MRLNSAAITVAALLVCPAIANSQGRRLPTPASIIGFEPGTDRKLPEWQQVVSYFKALDAASPRVQTRVLGKTTLGRPFIAAFIADSATLANLPKVRDAQRKLSDPRLTTAQQRATLERNGKVVVLVTSSIHSTEVGGILTPLSLAYRLASSEDAEAKAIRSNTVVILVPSLNPDGVDIVGNWYKSTLGTKAEGTSPPSLYHYYTGHDNNRDWYAFTQVETQMVIDSLYGQWHPQIVNDIHQQGSEGTRIFIPPYMDPIEPNIDPIIAAGVAQMGKSMTWRLITQGLTGVANNTSYDAWTPARAYQHYHGAIRILTETASASLASPINVSFDSLRAGYNVDPKVTGVDFLTKWEGGKWTIGDIVKYQMAASWALLAQAADDRALWLSSYSTVQARSTQGRNAPGRGDWPSMFVIPPQPARDTAINFALRILQRGQVEIDRTSAPFTSNGRTFPAGSYVISTAQPYGGFAKTLLENQRYPDLREYPGGPPIRPYDVVAHTLPLLFGFDAALVSDPVSVQATRVQPVSQIPWIADGLSNNKSRRIAIFANASPAMDEGWTRWVFDQYRIPFTIVSARDIKNGNLRARFDAIIIPDQQSRAIANGPNASYPDSLRGGLGTSGAEALGKFVDDGGTLVAFNQASNYAIQALSLPVKNEMEGVRPSDFYAPGSLLSVVLDRSNPLTAGYTAPVQTVWFEGSPVFVVTDSSRAAIIARYPEATVNPLISGWLLGAPKLAGKAAMVDVRRGAGHVVLFGFRPQYRAQSMATYPLLWNALRR